MRHQTAGLLGVMVIASTTAMAQERAYIVTYDQYLEEPGNLEIAVASTTGLPRADHPSYTAPWLELEYGVTGWWTAELYLEGVTTPRKGSGFTGWRWENRFRPLRGEHRITPVVYFEYEDINEASRIQKEIVGSGGLEFDQIAELRRRPAREFEAKLILGSVIGAWNVSENVIVEKNFSAQEGVEFGYAVGISRPLATLARGPSCHVCPENFVVGVEAYGGLGSTLAFAAGEQRHYVAPVVGWHVTDRVTLKASGAFGLTETSDRLQVRAGVGYELKLGARR